MGPDLETLINEAADELASALRHYGPGAHPGTGTEQAVHGGAGGRAKAEIKITSDVTGFHDEQTDGVLRAEDSEGKVIGYLDWSEYDDVVSVQMVEVEKNHRRKGIATALMERLRAEWPGEPIYFGFSTTEGTALRQALEKKGWEFTDQPYSSGAVSYAEMFRHYGPGPHPGTGTEQQVHAGAGGGREKKVKDRTRAGRRHFSEVAYADILLHGFRGRLFEKGTAQQADGWGNAQSRAAYDWITGVDKEANRRERDLERQIDRLTDRNGRALRGHGAEVADLRRQIEELETGLKYAVLRAVDDYVENTHFSINNRLRRGDALGVMRDHIDALDALMARAVTGENVVAFRGVGDDFGKRLRAGRTFTDRAFVSTTLYENILKKVEEGGWGETQLFDWHLAVLVPAGTHAYYTGRRHGHGGGSTKEYELLLDRGTTFKVLSVDRRSKTATIKVVGQRTHE